LFKTRVCVSPIQTSRYNSDSTTADDLFKCKISEQSTGNVDKTSKANC
jgi:hypothetical protein